MSLKKTKEVEKHLAAIEAAKTFLEKKRDDEQLKIDDNDDDDAYLSEEEGNVSELEDIISNAESLHEDMDNFFEE